MDMQKKQGNPFWNIARQADYTNAVGGFWAESATKAECSSRARKISNNVKGLYIFGPFSVGSLNKTVGGCLIEPFLKESNIYREHGTEKGPWKKEGPREEMIILGNI